MPKPKAGCGSRGLQTYKTEAETSLAASLSCATTQHARCTVCSTTATAGRTLQNQFTQHHSTRSHWPFGCGMRPHPRCIDQANNYSVPEASQQPDAHTRWLADEASMQAQAHWMKTNPDCNSECGLQVHLTQEFSTRFLCKILSATSWQCHTRHPPQHQLPVFRHRRALHPFA